ncbi:MAG: hypothetical protein ACK5NC_01210 [Vibrio sp.]
MNNLEEQPLVNTQLDDLIEQLIDMSPQELNRIQQYIQEMQHMTDFSTPVLSEQEKQRLAKLLKL